MKIILCEKVSGLGKMGDVVDVANGYARNYLIPKSLASKADSRSVKQVEHTKSIIARKVQKEKEMAQSVAQQISQITVQFTKRAGEGGKLFGSVGTKDITSELSRLGFDFDRKVLVLDKPIKELGVFFLPVKIQHDVTGTIKVEVLAEEAAEPAEAKEDDKSVSE